VIYPKESVKMSTAPRKKLSVDELRLTPEFQRLTPKQQLFCATYCGAGLLDGSYNSVVATNTAYRCKSMEVARIMSYSLMQNIRVIAVLNRHFNTEPIEDFLVQVDRAINNKKLTTAQLQALKLKGDILGFTTRLPGTPNFPPGTIPQDVLDAERDARKAKRKTPERKSSIKEPGFSSGFGS
jgi:hypothetical protein